MTAAYRQVAEALVSGADGESAWSRRQRSILLACETGLATACQRRQAEEMLAVDPRCRATLAELRVALRDVAAVLPFPAAVEEERTRRLLESLVDGVDRLLPGGRRAARQVAESVAPSGAAEPVTAGAVALGAGGAAKVALACLAAGRQHGIRSGCARQRPSLRPRIYVSSGTTALLSGAQLDAVLAHEAHHARRRDPLRMLVARTLAESAFFVPVLHRSRERYAALADMDVRLSSGRG
jgi:Zn-dependent protease with chaperone function